MGEPRSEAREGGLLLKQLQHASCSSSVSSYVGGAGGGVRMRSTAAQKSSVSDTWSRRSMKGHATIAQTTAETASKARGFSTKRTLSSSLYLGKWVQRMCVRRPPAPAIPPMPATWKIKVAAFSVTTSEEKCVRIIAEWYAALQKSLELMAVSMYAVFVMNLRKRLKHSSKHEQQQPQQAMTELPSSPASFVTRIMMSLRPRVRAMMKEP
mmetsp:Transcript_48709/g.155693  ORF Transcript_48709/g.155693 Transcript_48709/m.155693 type:complete len:210 (-) Transcript_48709:1214-1843(-)